MPDTTERLFCATAANEHTINIIAVMYFLIIIAIISFCWQSFVIRKDNEKNNSCNKTAVFFSTMIIRFVRRIAEN